MATRLFNTLLALSGPLAVAVLDTCPGSIRFTGYGDVQLSNAMWYYPGMRADHVSAVDKRAVIPKLFSRTYFTKACTNATYGTGRFATVPLLGKTLRYTVDLSGTGCGCNAAFYLSNMKQNAVLGECHDYYCDANKICGAACAEIDLQEANMHAWRTALHLWDSPLGFGVGYGGGGADWVGAREWADFEYGPNGNFINTTQPFQVAISFPRDGAGQLLQVIVEVSQAGRALTAANGQFGYQVNGRIGMSELSVALEAGMTPVISYFASSDMLWLDGKGKDGRGPCEVDEPDKCAESVSFYDFSVEPIGDVQPLRQRLAQRSTSQQFV